jgi:pimeloyl-ACP methyl ester carboxylesterase
MRYFVAPGEDRLHPALRDGQRGEFARLSHGMTHFELAGPEEGPMIVFVPGLTIAMDFWDAVVAPLQQWGYRTLVYSAYGRGYSDRVDAVYNRGLFVAQLDELLCALDAQEIHLVGSSMGALIAVTYARRLYRRIASLTLSGPAGLAKRRNPVTRLPRRGPIAPLFGKYLMRRGVMRHLEHNVRTPEDAARLTRMVGEGLRFEGSMYAVLSTVLSFPLAEQDDLFDAGTARLPPTMLLWGAEDEVTPPGDFQRAVDLLRPVHAELIERCGHMAPFERPGMFADKVSELISGQLVRESPSA